MRLLSVFIALILLLSDLTLSQAAELALNWKPEPEFGGFYEAKRLGLYQKAGIDLEILPGGAGQPVAQMVGAKKAKFGIASADDVILGRNQKAKIVAIYAVYQNNPQGFMVHPDRKVKSLKELFQSEGTIALQKGLPYTLWIQKQYAPIRATQIPYTGGIAEFLKKGSADFAQQCFVFSEPIAAKQKGVDSNTVMISESGFNPYLAAVIVHEDTLKNEPKIVEKFVNATREGWVSYLKDAKKTNELMNQLNPSLDLKSFHEAARVQTEFVLPNGQSNDALGKMTHVRWKTLYEQLKELKLVKSGMTVDSFFQNP